MNELLPKAPAPVSPVAPLAAGSGGGAAANAPLASAPAMAASRSVPLFGGHRGGKRRADGLPNGSPEAMAADRLKERERKRQARAAAAAAEPPALPSADAGAAPAPAGTPPALAGDSGADAGLAPVAWDASTLKPLFEQLIPTLETLTIGQLTSRATKARLPGEVVKEIEKDAKWAPPAKKAVEISAPRVCAKMLNRTGISAEHQDEMILATACASIFASHTLLLRKLDKLIGEQQRNQETKAEEKKP